MELGLLNTDYHMFFKFLRDWLCVWETLPNIFTSYNWHNDRSINQTIREIVVIVIPSVLPAESLLWQKWIQRHEMRPKCLRMSIKVWFLYISALSCKLWFSLVIISSWEIRICMFTLGSNGLTTIYYWPKFNSLKLLFEMLFPIHPIVSLNLVPPEISKIFLSSRLFQADKLPYHEIRVQSLPRPQTYNLNVSNC